MPRTWDGDMRSDPQSRHDPGDDVEKKSHLKQLSDICFLGVFLGSTLDRFPGIPEGHTTNEQMENKV